MNKYTIYCTQEQTRKALELGAPIIKMVYAPIIRYEDCGYIVNKEEGFAYHVPTAEQMMGWLEEQKIFVHIVPCVDISCSWHITSKGYNQYGYSSDIKVCKTRKEATIAAIDAALEYLINNKK